MLVRFNEKHRSDHEERSFSGCTCMDVQMCGTAGDVDVPSEKPSFPHVPLTRLLLGMSGTPSQIESLENSASSSLYPESTERCGKKHRIWSQANLSK